ncbi:TauD/TfdA family dioxygenase [Leptolyngbya sp. 15MV]|nr:TauD/TfdA family dioxygenase [Leptolyngbya sp. 15MV]
MRNTRIEVAPVAGALGAEIHGVDLRTLDDATFAEIRQAFHDHSVIFFHDQDITPEQHIAFARRFGPINVNRFFTPVEGHPEIAEVRKEPEQKKNIGEVWHTDHSYDQVPALGSMLVAREVPDHGGDTMFASMYEAYDALSDGLKRTLETLRAVHSSRHVFGHQAGYHGNDLKDRLRNPDAATQDAVHPVVIRHPDTGRKALYVNRNF